MELYKARQEDDGSRDKYWEVDENAGDTANAGAEGEARIGLHNFINHPDPEVCNAAVDILTDDDNYIVSRMWKRFDIVIESERDRLSEIIPRIVVLYKSKAIEGIIDDLQKRLKESGLSDEELSEITFRIATLNKERMSIARKLSRLIL